MVLHLTECVRHTVKNTRWKREVTVFSHGSTTTYNTCLPWQPGTRTLSETFTLTIPLWRNKPTQPSPEQSLQSSKKCLKTHLFQQPYFHLREKNNKANCETKSEIKSHIKSHCRGKVKPVRYKVTLGDIKLALVRETK